MLYQVRYYEILGLSMVNQNHVKIFLGGSNYDEIEVCKLGEINSWKKNIMSFRSQLPNCTRIQTDI